MNPSINSNQGNRLVFIGLLFFFILINATRPVTSNESYEIFKNIRYLSIGVLLILIPMIILLKKINRIFLVGLFFNSALFFYGFFQGKIFGGANIVMDKIIMNFMMINTGLFIVSYLSKSINLDLVLNFFILYQILVLGLLIYSHGILFSPFPSYNFSYISSKKVYYSQGVSGFFGVLTLLILFKMRGLQTILPKILFFTLFLISLFLSVMGGGRGEVLFLFLLISVYLINVLRWKFLLFLPILIVFISLFFQQYIDNLIIFERINKVVSNGNYGERDILFGKALRLIFTDPFLFFFGKGFGYFQFHYGFTQGVYPHNILIELIIIYGILPFMVFLGICIVKFKLFFEYLCIFPNLYFYLFFYYFLLDLKSGEFGGDWFSITFLIYYISKQINFIFESLDQSQSTTRST